MVKHWIWKSIVAGLCGSTAHLLLMFLKNLQSALSHLVSAEVHPAVPWALSFLNGATFLGFAFARGYRLLPGKNAATKGVIFGLLGWAMMGLLFFPLIGLGLFAFQLGLGIAPALFSLAMVLAYSVVMGMVYATLNS